MIELISGVRNIEARNYIWSFGIPVFNFSHI